MRERGRYQLQFLKTRSSSGVGSKVDLEFNPDTLRITDAPEDESYNSSGSGTNTTNSIYDRLKTQTKLEPPSSEVKAPKAEDVQGNRLREFLNSMKK